jgi:Uma2 family endonuclease
MLCVEVLSPDVQFSQTISQTIEKCEENHRWGVPVAWIVPATERRGWTFVPNQRPQMIPSNGNLEAEVLSIPLPEIFSVLD